MLTASYQIDLLVASLLYRTTVAAVVVVACLSLLFLFFGFLVLTLRLFVNDASVTEFRMVSSS